MIVAARMAEILASVLDAGDVPAGEVLGDHRQELAGLLDLARLDAVAVDALNDALHALSIAP